MTFTMKITKLCGILIENLVQGAQIKNSIIGIGVNVNQESFPQVLSNAISINQILHQDYDLIALLSEICRNIEAWYLNLKAGKIAFIRNTYLTRLYWLNENKRFKSQNGTFNGTIKAVRESGLLIVQTNDGEEIEFSLKEIKFLNN